MYDTEKYYILSSLNEIISRVKELELAIDNLGYFVGDEEYVSEKDTAVTNNNKLNEEVH